MEKATLFLIFNLIILSILPGQEIEWIKQISGENYEYGIEVDTDAGGNIYAIGYSSGSIIIDGDTINPNPNGEGDAFITKHNVDGEFLWAKTFGGNDPIYKDEAFDIHIDIDGNCFVVFSVSGDNFHFDNEPIAGISGNGQSGGRGVMLKLDSSGNILWWEHYDMQSFQEVATDPDGNVYLTGYFNGSGTIGGQTLINPTSGSTTDMFIAKFTASGSLIWVNHVGGDISNSRVYGMDVVLNPSNDYLYVTGNVRKTAYFETTSLTPLSSNAIFLVKYNTSGVEEWAKLLESGEYRVVVSMDISPIGNIGISGYQSYYTGNTDSYYGIYTPEGFAIFTSNPYSTTESNMYGISFNSNDEFYISGYFQNHINLFDSSYNLPGKNNIVIKYGIDYNVKWASIFPGNKWLSSLHYYNNSILYISRCDQPLFYNNNQDSIIPVSGDAIIMKLKDNDVNTSIHKAKTENEVLVYPIPAGNTCNIVHQTNEINHIKVTDISGRVVVNIKDPGKKVSIDLSTCKPGIYFIVTEKRGVTYSLHKIIKK